MSLLSFGWLTVLAISNVVLLLVCAALWWTLRSLRRRHQQDISMLESHNAQLQQAQQSLSKSTIGMGRRIKELEAKLQQVQRNVALPNVDDDVFEQASRLISLGATADDLVESCGMARGEAELLVSLKRSTH
ncbi:MAG: DUF2802 domain-containing protein [Bacterioplanes sp.]|nr:DUF2802 domain-containing protein [Bacterioplanes sp.]